MKKLKDIIIESLLGDELDNVVDKLADEHKIEKLLSSPETFIKGYQELITNFGGTRKSIPVSQMKLGEYYIVFMQDTLYDRSRWAIYIIVPTKTGLYRNELIRVKFWKKFHDLIEGEDNCELIFKDTGHYDYYNGLSSISILNKKSKYNDFDYRYIYKLPESYKFLIDFIKKKSKEK